VARGNAVIIIWEEGEEQLWGHEDDASIAVTVAEDIQLGLRAIQYVRTSLLDSLRETMGLLEEAGVPAEHLDDIMYEDGSSYSKKRSLSRPRYRHNTNGVYSHQRLVA
jgi:hypothetical protein